MPSRSTTRTHACARHAAMRATSPRSGSPALVELPPHAALALQKHPAARPLHSTTHAIALLACSGLRSHLMHTHKLVACLWPPFHHRSTSVFCQQGLALRLSCQ